MRFLHKRPTQDVLNRRYMVSACIASGMSVSGASAGLSRDHRDSSEAVDGYTERWRGDHACNAKPGRCVVSGFVDCHSGQASLLGLVRVVVCLMDDRALV